MHTTSFAFALCSAALIDENAFPSPTSMVLADNVMMEKERHIRVVNALRVVLLIFPMCRGE